MPQHLTLIDGNSILFRAYYGVHSHLTRTDGTPVNAVYGFCNMILPLVAAAKPHEIFICVFDAGRRTFRNDIYPEYKANRAETPADLAAQFELSREAVRAFGIPLLVIDGVEADDVIATLCNHECALNRQTRVVTGDKDLMQLVSHCVFLYDGMKEKEIRAPEVLEKFGVRPDQVIDVQSLMGDSSDNVPGVPGIGPKTATELIQEFGSLDNLYKNVNEISKERIRKLLNENRDKAEISRKLVTLKSDVKLPKFSDEPMKFDADGALAFARDKLESPALAAKIRKLFGNAGTNQDSDEVPHPRAEPALRENKESESAAHQLLKHNSSHSSVITAENELDEFLSHVDDVLAIDTETTGLNQMTDKLVGISLAVAPDRGVYIPLRHKEQEAATDLFSAESATTSHQPPAAKLSLDAVKRKLWPIFKKAHVVKVGHNLKYDLHIFENEGWDTSEIAPIDDTMLLSYILYGAAHTHGLDELAHLYLGHENIKFDSLFPPKTKDSDKRFAEIAVASAAPYAAEDAWVTYALYKIFRETLENLPPLLGGAVTHSVTGGGSDNEVSSPSSPSATLPPKRGEKDRSLLALYENCDRPLLRILMQMERAGVLIDQSSLRELSDVLHKKSDEIQEQIWKAAHFKFNIGSPKQLAEILYEKLGVPAPKTNSTDAATLGDLADAHPIINMILEWRSLTKLSGTYADALPRQIGRDGRIHTTFLQTSTNTGRLSSRDPNLQNIPIKTDLGAQIRKCFVAPDGRVLISADYSQIQLRLMAHIADVKILKEIFTNGEDIHSMTARRIFALAPHATVTKDQRHAAKTVNFSIIYGISPFGLGNQLGISQSDAKKLIDSYMANFPEIDAYIEKTKKFAIANGFVLTPWGRRIELPEIRNPRMRAYALRAAINAPIQGFEADLMRFAMVKIGGQLEPHSDQIKMLLQVHDELVFECDEKHAEYWAEKIKHEMENVAKLSVPIAAETKIGKSWDK